MLATYLTYENALMVLPWVTNSISITAAYCLSRSKVVAGRIIALFGAMGWASYGLLLGEMSFVLANLVFIYIYGSAVYKFNRKRDQYKETLAETEHENAELRKKLALYEANANRELARRQKNLLKLVSRARTDLDQLEKAAKLHLAPLSIIPIKEESAPENEKPALSESESS